MWNQITDKQAHMKNNWEYPDIYPSKITAIYSCLDIYLEGL